MQSSDPANSQSTEPEGKKPVAKRWASVIRTARLFSIVSWGCAATHWVGKVLNSHPDILCLHSGNWAIQEDNPQFTDQHYLEALLNMGKGYVAIGDVHGIARHEIGEARQKYGSAFEAVVLVREPMERIKSQLAHFENARRFGRDALHNYEYIHPIAEARGLSGFQDDIYRTMFAHGANMLNAILDEVSLGTIYKFEDLISDPQAFVRLINEISGGRVSITDEWLQQATSIPPVSPHRLGADPTFGDWEIEALTKMIDRESWKIYESLGYAKPDFAW